MKILTSIRHICRPEAPVRSVDFNMVVVLPQTLVPLQHKVLDAVRLRRAVGPADVWRVRQLRIRSWRSRLEQNGKQIKIKNKKI